MNDQWTGFLQSREECLSMIRLTENSHKCVSEENQSIKINKTKINKWINILIGNAASDPINWQSHT